MLVVRILQQPLVPLTAVRGARRGRHVIRISLLLALSGFNSNLSPLVKAPEGQNNDLVVQEGAKDQDYEAWDSLPLEWLKTQKDTANPDRDRSRAVNR